MKSDFRTESRYLWKFDEVPPAFLTTHYWDWYERISMPDDTIRNIYLPVIDNRMILEKFGYLIGIPVPQPQEQFVVPGSGVFISLRINGASVVGYSGKDHNISSWMQIQPGPGTNPFTQTAQNLKFDVPLCYPIYNQNTQITIRTQNNTGRLLRVHLRLRGRYID